MVVSAKGRRPVFSAPFRSSTVSVTGRRPARSRAVGLSYNSAAKAWPPTRTRTSVTPAGGGSAGVDGSSGPALGLAAGLVDGDPDDEVSPGPVGLLVPGPGVVEHAAAPARTARANGRAHRAVRERRAGPVVPMVRSSGRLEGSGHLEVATEGSSTADVTDSSELPGRRGSGPPGTRSGQR